MSARAGVVLAVVLLASLVPLAAASPHVPSASAAPPPDLRIGFLQRFGSLNPYMGVTDPSLVLYGLLYDYPYTFDQDGNLQSNVITNSSCADASCAVWNYTVRQGIFWNDPQNSGSHPPLTAADVNFTWNYDSQYLSHVWAFEPYFNRVVLCSPSTAGRCGAVQSKTDPWNVTVYFDRPFASGRDLMAPIVQAAQWSAVAPSFVYAYANADPIGTGPFIADPNIYNELLNIAAQPLHLTRNPSYHPVGSSTPTIQISDLYLYQYSSASAMATALEAGNLDVAEFTTSTISPLRGVPNIIVQSALQAIHEWNYIGISQCDSPAANLALDPARWDVNVRHALAMATNKDYIVQQIYGGHGARGDSLLSPITPQWWYDPVVGGDNQTFNLVQAAALLTQDGWTGTWSDTSGTYRLNPSPITLSIQSSAGAGGVENITNTTKTIPAGTRLNFTLAVRPPAEFPEELQTAQYLQGEWAQIGVRVNIKVETTESGLATDVYSCKVETYIWFWSSEPDPNYMLSMQSSWTLDGWNDNAWVNTTYNRLYIAQLGDQSATQRIADVKAAEKVQYEAAVFLIYTYPYGEWAMRTDLWQGWGDWAAHPYRQLNVPWSANPLFFDLSCPSCSSLPMQQPPAIPVIQPAGTIATYAGVNLTFSATTFDLESYDGLNWTWTWGDGTYTQTAGNASNPVSAATHAWATAGTYQVQVGVTDGWNPVVSSEPVTVEVLTPPSQPGWLAGNVTDSATGLPIAGAVIAATPQGGSPIVASSNAEGVYNLTLPAGSCTVQVSAPFYGVFNSGSLTIVAGHTLYESFQLLATTAPVQPSLSGAMGRPGQAIPFTGSIEAITSGNWTLHFGDGASISGTYFAGTTLLSENHTFAAEGNLTASLVTTSGSYTRVANATILVDGTPPTTTPSLSGTHGRLTWFRSSVTVTLSATDTLSGVALTMYRIGGGAWQTYLAPFAIAAQGNTTVNFLSLDKVGNAESMRTLVVAEDSAAPTASIVKPTASSTVTSSTVQVNWTAADSVSGIASVQISVDNGTFTNVTGTSTTLQGLADGPHTVTLKVTDGAGNVATTSVSFTVQTGLLGGLSTVVLGGIAAAVIVVAVGVALLLRWRRARSPPGGAPPPPPPPPPS